MKKVFTTDFWKTKVWKVVAPLATFFVCLMLSTTFTFRDVFGSIESSTFYICSMVLCFVLCFVAWHWIFKFVKCLRERNKRAIDFAIFAGIFFCVCVIFFILIYPGFWLGDEDEILFFTKQFKLYAWHHVFTQVYYIVGMFFFTMPSFIVLFQIILFSCIVGHILSDIKSILNSNVNPKWMFLLLVPFLLPIGILHALYPMRVSIICYTLLLLFYEIVMLKIKKQPLSMQKAVILGALTGILAFLRSELIFLLVLIPFALFLFSKPQLTKKVVCAFFVMIFTLALPMVGLQKLAFSVRTESNSLRSGQYSEVGYQQTAFCLAFGNLAKIAYKQNDKIVEEIRKFCDIDAMVDQDINGGSAWFRGYFRHDLSNAEMNEFMWLYVKLIFKYPGDFIVQRLGLYGRTNFNIKSTYSIPKPSMAPDGNIANEEFAPKLRATVIKILEMEGYLRVIVYNSLPALILFITLFIICLSRIRKDKRFLSYALLILVLLIENAVCFFVAPEKNFLYYSPTLFIGGFVLFVIIFLRKINPQKKQKVINKAESGDN